MAINVGHKNSAFLSRAGSATVQPVPMIAVTRHKEIEQRLNRDRAKQARTVRLLLLGKFNPVGMFHLFLISLMSHDREFAIYTLCLTAAKRNKKLFGSFNALSSRMQ